MTLTVRKGQQKRHFFRAKTRFRPEVHLHSAPFSTGLQFPTIPTEFFTTPSSKISQNNLILPVRYGCLQHFDDFWVGGKIFDWIFLNGLDRLGNFEPKPPMDLVDRPFDLLDKFRKIQHKFVPILVKI